MYNRNSEWIRLGPNSVGIAKVCNKPKKEYISP